jgi:hypothetical protein
MLRGWLSLRKRPNGSPGSTDPKSTAWPQNESEADCVSTISIFDPGPRNLDGGAAELISDFDYLNASNRVEAERVRVQLDRYLARYPEAKREDLRGRLRSIDDVAFQSAAFELVLHELMVRGGNIVVEVEPTVPGTTKRPDFLMRGPDGVEFYLEATLATGRSMAEAGAQKRLAQVFKAIQGVPSPDFFLSIFNSGMPSQPVSGKRLKHELRMWLSTLSYDAIAAAYEGGNETAIPTLKFEEHGLRLRIQPVPRLRSRGSIDPTRAIAGRMLDPLTVQPEVPIRAAFSGKAGRYGALDRPYVIAVNAMDIYADGDSVIDALFGSLAVEIGMMTDGRYFERPGRAPGGALGSAENPQFTRVSAVISVDRLTPWRLGQARSRLIVNPWAQRPLAATHLDIDQWRPEDEKLVLRKGRTITEILGLVPDWPEKTAADN